MKIAVISSNVFPVPIAGYGGLEAVAYYCAKGLAERGHQILLMAPDGSYLPHPNVTVVHTGPAGVWDEKMGYGGVPGQRDGYWKHLPNMICVLDHSWQKHSYLLKQEGVLKAPVLGVCHAPINTMLASPPPVEHPCIVCISEDQKNHYEALFHPAKAMVAYNGIDLSFHKPLNIPRTDRFLFLARFSKIKGPELAIEACLRAGVGLDMIGDTSITQEPDVYQRCKQMADGKQIRIIGGVSRGEAVWWMSQAHAMIHPVRDFREPFGLAPVESLACGCPVISWDSGAMCETMLPSLLVNSMDQLVNMIKEVKNAKIQDSDRQGYRKWVEDFSIENSVNRYEELAELAIERGW